MIMVGLYPLSEPYQHGMLDVGDGNSIYWEAKGNPHGKPALMVHGGPGAGAPIATTGHTFNPEKYRAIVFDQRGCGRSTPHASDPATDMSVNTTHHLITDMELLREHLGVEKWLVRGHSWGTTLTLAYAQRYPHRVSEILLTSLFTARRSEIDWLYRGVRAFFPEAWEHFRLGVPEADRDGDLVAAYARLMEDPGATVRATAAASWVSWEDAVLSLEKDGHAGVLSAWVDDKQLAFVRICSHYFAHGAWLEEGELLRDAGKLAGIPGVILQGRTDMSGPVRTAWELAQAWPGSELIVVEDSGHLGSDTMTGHLIAALDRFAAR
jgi:proline iminopeptidase